MKRFRGFRFFLWMTICLSITTGGNMAFAWRDAEVYDMSYDQTYLTAISALNDMPNWYLLETDQTHGMITVERTGFFHPEQRVKLIVKRLEPYKTKVQIVGKKNTIFQQKFLKAIDKRVRDQSLTYPT